MILTIFKQMSSLFFFFHPSDHFFILFCPCVFSLFVSSYIVFILWISISITYSNDRGSKADMQAAAGGAEYVGDEQGIMEGEQQYP